MSAPDLTPASTPSGAADAVETLWGRLLALVPGLDADDWSRPVPACPGWDVHDVVGHIGGLTMMFLGRPQPEPPADWTPPEGLSRIDAFTESAAAARRDRSPEAQVAELVEAGEAWATSLRALDDLDGDTVGPLGATTHQDFMSVRLFDVWHHLWDLHQALDVPFDLADESDAAQRCHAYVRSRVPWLYGKRGGAPDGAGVRVDLGAPLHAVGACVVRDGRAGWAEPGAATDVVHSPAAPFTLLMSGRISRDEAAALGLTAEGVEAERLLATRLFG